MIHRGDVNSEILCFQLSLLEDRFQDQQDSFYDSLDDNSFDSLSLKEAHSFGKEVSYHDVRE